MRAEARGPPGNPAAATTRIGSVSAPEEEPRKLAARGLAVAAGVVIGVVALTAVVAVLWPSEGATPTATPTQANHGKAAETSEPNAALLRRLGLTRKIPNLVRKACAEARRLAKTQVLCPKLIPDIPLIRSEGLWGSIVFDDEPRIYMVSFNNAGGFFNRPLEGVEHWITGGGKAALVEKWILTDFANEVEGDATLVRSVEQGRRMVRVYRFPQYPGGGVNGDHWAAFVRVGGQLVFASLHGKRYVEAAIAMALDLARQAKT
jgi:hypothetical protein